MTPYLVTIDIGMPVPESPELMESIESYAQHIELAESTYVITSDESAAEVYTTLRRHLESKDRIYVFELGEHFAGRGPTMTIDWLNEHIQTVHHQV